MKSALKRKDEWEHGGHITLKDIWQICQTRMLYADLLARAPDPETSHAAKMVRDTVAAIEAELLELIP